MSVGTKVIAPFLVLVVVLSILVSWFATAALSAAATAAINAQAAREQTHLASDFTSFSARQSTFLRNLQATRDLGPAIKSQRVGPLAESAIFPQVANQLPDPLRVGVIDAAGTEVVQVSASPGSPTCTCTSGRSLIGWPRVRDALAGRSDAQGNRFVGVAQDSVGPILYSIGPVSDGRAVVGAMYVGEPLSYLAAQSRSLSGFDVALYDPSGRLLAATADIPSPSNPNRTTHTAVTVHGEPMEVFVYPWRLRGAIAGRALVMVPGGSATDARGSLPFVLGAIFLGAVVLTVLVGLFIARTLTRPLGRLVRATDEVAAGHLEHRVAVHSADEIGRLTVAFNRMTETLGQSADRIAASTEATLQTLAAAIDARDAYTHGHSMRVMRYSVEMARGLGMDEERIERVRRGCMVHDVGKIGVRDSILGKPTRLTETEEAQMQLHPLIGHSMLRHLVWEVEVLDIVLHHHEKWDGTGYPGRLRETEIPELARLVAIADTLDAMTSNRPYRSAHPFEFAAAEIKRMAGTQFDPRAVEAFAASAVRLEAMVHELAPTAAAADPGDVAALLDAMVG